jgi:thymidylate kinase
MEMTTLPAPGARDLSDLVTAVFQQWRAHRVEFLILRNYEGLPKDTTNDIDVLVLPAEAARAEQMLVDTARQAGYHLHNRAEFVPVSLFFHHPASLQQIQFDLFPGLTWRGFELLPPRALLDRRVERGGFAIPHPAHEAVNNLLTRQIYWGRVKDRYKPIITSGFRSAPAEARAQLAGMFGARLANELAEGILAERWADVEARTGAMRRQLIRRRLCRQPVATLRSLLRDLKRFAGRLRRPPGLTVVLLGADGSGKSTVAAGLTEALRGTFQPDKSRRVHWKPAVFLRRRRAARPPTTDPHGQPPRGRAASLAALLYHWLEFFIGAWTQFLPVRFRNGLVLIDRYHYDFVVDPRRYRLNVSPAVARALFRLIPAPDLVFLLDAPPAVLQARKTEVPAAETRRQREAFLALAATLPNARILDAARPVDEVVRAATREVLRYLEARQAKRMTR